MPKDFVVVVVVLHFKLFIRVNQKGPVRTRPKFAERTNSWFAEYASKMNCTIHTLKTRITNYSIFVKSKHDT